LPEIFDYLVDFYGHTLCRQASGPHNYSMFVGLFWLKMQFLGTGKCFKF